MSGRRERHLFSRTVRVFAYVMVTTSIFAGQGDPGQALPNLLHGNETFGRKLLQQVHSEARERNVVVSPISLTLVFAALQSSDLPVAARKEIGKAFGWGEYANLEIPSHMLLAAFEEPTPPPKPRSRPEKKFRTFAHEGAWITNTVLYRSENTLQEPFVSQSEKYFGMKFKSTGINRPTSADLANARKSLGPLPSVSTKNDVWISSATHFHSTWTGNTFSMSEPFQGEFRTASGEQKRTEMLTSELSGYPYAKTDTFEAVALPCGRGYMLAVLPALGKHMQELERELAENPETLDAALMRQVGRVTIPTFRIRFETDYRKQLQDMGIEQVFKDLGLIVRVPKSHLTQVAQKTDFQVDREGIHADAETIVGAVYGGIRIGKDPFHVELNRPFLFFVRDHATNTLLFLGALMDPTQN
jgi:serine protease inhibitor